MKLWDKGYSIPKKINRFTVGNDFLLDKKLVKFDCIASIAHAKMLGKIGVLNKKETYDIIQGLREIIKLDAENKFEILEADEDCHTAIESYLVKRLGETGKKIHTARSRNDQVLTAIRLYEKEELMALKKLLLALKSSLQKKVKEYKYLGMPGYTHMQRAMPTTFGDWIGAYVCAIDDDIVLTDNVAQIIDKSPLGSAAGFGVPVFDVDRIMTARLMGFSKVIKNPIYCQHSRGKYEAHVMNLMSQVMLDLNKLSTDLILFSMKEFGYVIVPKEFCTGSSIMPQKKNPDVLELIRAKYHIVLGEEIKVKSLISNLISGYNRDMQLTKEPLFNSIDITKECVDIMTSLVEGITVDKKACKDAMTGELYATLEAYRLVKRGMPFRDAYKKVSKKFLKL